MNPPHPSWDNFSEYLAGPPGIRTRLEFDKLIWKCEHAMQFSLAHYLLDQYSGIDDAATYNSKSGASAHIKILLSLRYLNHS